MRQMMGIKTKRQSPSTKMCCGADQLIMLLQLMLFVLLYTTTFLQCSYSSSSLANNTNEHFAGNKSSRFVTLDQLSAAAVMDLQGGVDEGAYRVTLRLGQYAQEYSFTIDTGSDLTWVNCETRSPYRYPHPAYNPRVLNKVFCNDPICSLVEHPTRYPCNSSRDECHYKIGYVDGSSTRGNVIRDSLALPFTNVDHSLLPPSIKIGCGSRQYHPPSTTVNGFVDSDGILGLARDSDLSIVHQLAERGIMRPVFGHCMSRPNNGYFFIGAGQPLPHAITWARMARLPHYYSPGRANLLFDGHLTNLKNLVTIFDSGSTLSYFKTSALQAIIDLVKDNLIRTHAPLRQVHSHEDYSICWRGPRRIRSVDDVAVYFKTMTLIFPVANNVRFELPPFTYLLEELGDVCFGIDDSAKIGLRDVNLIGDIFFQNKLVIYDLDRNMIGWAPSNCENRRMKDRKHGHINGRKYHRRDFSKHHFTTLPMRRQPPPINYTSIKL